VAQVMIHKHCSSSLNHADTRTFSDLTVLCFQGLYVHVFEENNFTGSSERIVGNEHTSREGFLLNGGPAQAKALMSVRVLLCDSIAC
jgi:hypothetical protein